MFFTLALWGKGRNLFIRPRGIGNIVENRNRHSRVSGNPERYCLMLVLPPNRRRIPAYAGMTVGAAGKDGFFRQ